MANETPQSSKRRPTTDGIRTVTGDTFNTLVLEGVGPIVVEFMSYGCAHCRAIEPVLQQVAEMVKVKEAIYRVNIAVDPELAAAYLVRGTPTFVMFAAGREVGRAEGVRPTFSGLLSVVTRPFES